MSLSLYLSLISNIDSFLLVYNWTLSPSIEILIDKDFSLFRWISSHEKVAWYSSSYHEPNNVKFELLNIFLTTFFSTKIFLLIIWFCFRLFFHAEGFNSYLQSSYEAYFRSGVFRVKYSFSKFLQFDSHLSFLQKLVLIIKQRWRTRISNSLLHQERKEKFYFLE